LFDGVHKLMEVHWFDDVGIDAQSVGTGEVGFFAGRGEHDHGDVFQERVGAHVFKDLEAIEFGHFDVQQDHHGWIIGAFGVGSLAEEVIEGFDSVTGDNDLISQVIIFQGGESQLHILPIIFDQQDTFQWVHG
jgi:hypothetical protein